MRASQRAIAPIAFCAVMMRFSDEGYPTGGCRLCSTVGVFVRGARESDPSAIAEATDYRLYAMNKPRCSQFRLPPPRQRPARLREVADSIGRRYVTAVNPSPEPQPTLRATSLACPFSPRSRSC